MPRRLELATLHALDLRHSCERTALVPHVVAAFVVIAQVKFGVQGLALRLGRVGFSVNASEMGAPLVGQAKALLVH